MTLPEQLASLTRAELRRVLEISGAEWKASTTAKNQAVARKVFLAVVAEIVVRAA